MSDSLKLINMLSEELHIVQDLNTNLYQNDLTLGEDSKNIIRGTNKASSETGKYLKFCKAFGLKQLIKSSTPLSITYQ